MEKEFKLVLTTSDRFQAEIAQEILSDNDIHCVVMNQQDSVIPSIGEIEIYVYENDLELALDILKKLKN
ncbi:DUF2007 domain-containing protein [Mangrovibacterium sp.]|uniref:putative signal transducing protein n=1 Tax=Mangrovibacterium sp. TaxID=1961364 RepID=UPI0035682975